MSTTVYVLTRNGRKPAWSRYRFDADFEAFAQLGANLYVKHGGRISKVREGVGFDRQDETNTSFPMELRWNYLDLGQPGVTKMLEGFDLVATATGGSPSRIVKFGYDQRTPTTFSDQCFLGDADSVPGSIWPYPISAPSLSPHIRIVNFDIGATVYTFTLYLIDNAPGTI